MRDCTDRRRRAGTGREQRRSTISDRAGMFDGRQITQQDVRSRGVAFGLCYSQVTGGQRKGYGRPASLSGATNMPKARPCLWSAPSAISSVVADLLTRWLHTEPIASSMLCAVIFAAWFGFGPGLLAIALSLLAFHYYLVPPINSFGLKQNLFAVGVSELPRLALFSITSLFVNFISAAQRSAKEAALQAAAKAARAERGVRLLAETLPALV